MHLRALDGVDPSLLTARIGAVVDALLRADHTVAFTVLTASPPTRQNTVLAELRARWPQPGGTPMAPALRAAALAFRVAVAPPASLQREGRALHEPLADLVRAMSKHERGLIDRACEGHPLGKPWWEWLKEVDHPNRSAASLGRWEAAAQRPVQVRA